MGAPVDSGDKPSRAPTLYIIIAMKLSKGLLLLLLAFGVYSLSDNNIPAEFRRLLEALHLDPEQAFYVKLGEKLATITPSNVFRIAVGTLLYSMFSLIEGIGLIFRVSWAGWLAIGESAFFIPLEINKLLSHYSTGVLVILVLNVVIVWYLFQNRERLFRHHAHHPNPAS